MNYRDVRKGNTQAEFNEDASKFLFGEIFIISVIVGLATASWAFWGLTLLALIATMWFRKGAIALTIILTLCWTILGFIIGNNFEGIITGVIFGIIALLVSLGVHSAAIEWMDDVSSRE